MTKCTFHKFGTSGEIEKHDAMCILPLNIGKVKNKYDNESLYYIKNLNFKHGMAAIH